MNLSHVNLSRVDLSHVGLSCVDLSYMPQSSVDLSHVNLSCVDLPCVDQAEGRMPQPIPCLGRAGDASAFSEPQVPAVLLSGPHRPRQPLLPGRQLELQGRVSRPAQEASSLLLGTCPRCVQRRSLSA